MKINAISAMSYGLGAKRAVSKQSSAVTSPINREIMEYPKGYIPYQINFAGGGSYSKLPGIKLLKTVKELPCLYCAEKMVQAKTIQSLGAGESVVIKTVKEFADSLSKQAGAENSKLIPRFVEAAKKNPLMPVTDFIENLESKKIFIPNSIKNAVKRPMTGIEYAQKAINTVAEYEDGLMPTERQVFKLIKAEFDKNPKQSISSIMSTLRNRNIGDFANSQTKILDEIEELAKSSLSKRAKERVLFETQRSKGLLRGNNSQFPFKRKKFIENLNRVQIAPSDVDAMQMILAKAETIPTSGKDVNAFIAKYSNRNVPRGNGGFVTRSDSEIIQRILDPSVQSVEHIRPQVTFKTSNGNYVGAKDVIQNLALAHKQCNSDRGHLTLEQYMRMNPKAEESIQKHVDFLIKEIKAGRLRGLEEYPKQLQETFSNETGGRLVLDISEIKEYLDKFLANKKH